LKMKKMFSLATTALLIIGSLFWSCKNDEVPELPENNRTMLKNGEIVAKTVCVPSYFSLLARNGLKAGDLIVSNDDYNLTINTSANSSISAIQLWVGTDPSNVAKNDKNIPVPARFNYQSSGNDEINISLGSLFPPPPPGGTYDGKTVYIFAHAVIRGSVQKEVDKYSAISEDKSHGISQVDLISTYTVCCQPQGCFPYGAFGGNIFTDGYYYYDNTENGGGSQDIHAENGEIAGTVQYASGILSFSFGGDWGFSGTQPSVTIEGFSEPGVSPSSLFSGEPDSESGIYSVPISPYPFFKIQFNLQKCN
jgi:hypothetical protein